MKEFDKWMNSGAKEVPRDCIYYDEKLQIYHERGGDFHCYGAKEAWKAALKWLLTQSDIYVDTYLFDYIQKELEN